MAKRRFSIAFWVVLFVVFVVMAIFGLPEYMNRTHGAARLLGLVALAVPLWPVVMLAVAIYRHVTLKTFLRDQDDTFFRR